MKARCSNPKNVNYKHYGGRGIAVCKGWLDFLPFLHWAVGSGYAPGLSIDRIDPDRGYEPSNCRWIPRGEQSRTTRAFLAAHPSNEPDTFTPGYVGVQALLR